MGTHHRGRAWALASFVLIGLFAWPAAAEPSDGVVRFSIDADLLSMADVQHENAAGIEFEQTVYGIGPNQLGGSGVQPDTVIGTTPLGFGLGYGVSDRLLLGMRFGFGLDVRSPEGSAESLRVLTMSLMPGLTFVPLGDRAKMFLSASPIFQLDRNRIASDTRRTLLGGFSLGIGTLIFVVRSASIDLGFHFEGRFGNYENLRGEETELRDLRGVVRLGISIWK